MRKPFIFENLQHSEKIHLKAMTPGAIEFWPLFYFSAFCWKPQLSDLIVWPAVTDTENSTENPEIQTHFNFTV